MIAVPQIRAVSLTGYVEVARFLGLDPYELLRRASLSPTMLEDPETRIPAAPAIHLLEESARLSGCESFGLMMAECRTFESIGPLVLLLERLGSVREVLHALARYRRHINDIVQVDLDEEDSAFIRLTLLPQLVAPQAMDLTVALTHVILAGVSRNSWRPDSVHFRHPRPRDTRNFDRFFPAPVVFDSLFDGLECSVASLDRPLPRGSAAMAENARRLLETVDLPPEEAPVSESVTRTIALLLPSGRATLEEVSRALDSYPRDVQRKLQREGHTFGDLLNKARRELSLRYLSNETQPIASVAELTGYSSTNSFSRWFVAEFGVAPGAWRTSSRSAPLPLPPQSI